MFRHAATSSTTRSCLRRRRRVGSSLVAGAIVLALSGCVKNFPNPFDRSSTSQDVELLVDNQNFNDVRIYKMGPEGRESIGYVTGRSSGEFTVSWRQTADIYFRVEVLAGRTYDTNAVQASPGDHLQLYIRENSSNTYLIRR
jgi:hypothetical protein